LSIPMVDIHGLCHWMNGRRVYRMGGCAGMGKPSGCRVRYWGRFACAGTLNRADFLHPIQLILKAVNLVLEIVYFIFIFFIRPLRGSTRLDSEILVPAFLRVKVFAIQFKPMLVHVKGILLAHFTTPAVNHDTQMGVVPPSLSLSSVPPVGAVMLL
jgi:hypothetical protein